MTNLLKELLHEYGLLYVSIKTINEARSKWSSSIGPLMSDEELSELPIEKDEPLMVIRIANGKEPDFLNEGEHDMQFFDKKTGEPVGKVSVLDVPEDEFYFFRAFRGGVANLASELPDFFYGMCLMHAHSLFEHYLTQLLRLVFLSRPEMLGKTKTLTYADVLEGYPSIDALIEKMVERELRELFYKSRRDLLEIIREKLGFKQLVAKWDEKIIELSLVRNGLAHNRGIVDIRLEEANNTYKQGTKIPIKMEVVIDAISTFRKFATEVDKVAEGQHLNRNKS